ncbi:MAG TPA: disulfide bond formation protein B [Rhabdochlamydiaceae bacterium]|nr:disulfide bond formation protein B [Rhabdochlamydiaceae bacterium]
MSVIKKNGLYFAWILACLATLGSLYFGEIKNHEPCSLCWYQRIAVFPLAVILGIAAFRRDYKIIPYALPLALIGLCLALFHVVLQYAPDSFLEIFCTGSEACTVKTSLFGPHYLSFLSLFGFILISSILIITEDD